MLKKIPLLFFLASNFVCYAQRTIGLKIYQNTDIFETTFDNSYEDRYGYHADITTERQANFNRFSIGMSFEGKKILQEVELFIPEINRSNVQAFQFPQSYAISHITAHDIRQSAFSARYEWSRKMSKTDKAISFSFGGGINPYFFRQRYDPHAETSYKRNVKTAGVNLSLIPRVTWQFANRFAADLNLPLEVFEYRFERYKMSNPAVPIRQQTRDVYSHHFLEKVYTVRLGFTYLLTSKKID